jgi:hypothetical protein
MPLPAAHPRPPPDQPHQLEQVLRELQVQQVLPVLQVQQELLVAEERAPPQAPCAPVAVRGAPRVGDRRSLRGVKGQL